MRRGSPVVRDPTLRFFLGNIGIGVGLAILLVAAIVWADPAGLGALLLSSSEHPLPLFLLGFFCALTFSAVQVSVAIMLRYEAPHDETPSDPPAGAVAHGVLLVRYAIRHRGTRLHRDLQREFHRIGGNPPL